uniref:Putative ovule protein n=1 Tax=Solanum chacoense TaxID=4108 RepID=A0A0V0HXV8_SOLCH
MGENRSAPTLMENKNTVISEKLSAESISKVNGFVKSMGLFNLNFPPQYDTKDSFSELSRSFLKVQHVHRGKISCIVSVKPPIMNVYGSLHGGAVGDVAVRVATACARTIVGKDKELFLGELSISYLSSAPQNVSLYGICFVLSAFSVLMHCLQLKHQGRACQDLCGLFSCHLRQC